MLGYDINQTSLLHEGQLLGVTKQGEMFSAVWMSLLAEKVKISVTLLEGGLSEYTIVMKHLSQGKPLLVP